MLRILHAADLHLDSPFAALPPELAVQRRKQQRQLPELLAELCRAHTCDLMLLAGDVFDGARVCPETVEAMQTAFGRCGVPVFISPGNHDPFTAASPWALHGWPDNVHIFSGTMEVVELPELRCRVWGAGFREQEASELLQPIARKNDGFLEIGVFHGDPLYPGAYHPISAQTLQNCGLDYLALGHIHKTQLPLQLGRTYYGWPGAPMGRGFDETGERGVFCVALDRGICETRFLPLPLPRYEILSVPAEAVEIPPQYLQTICRLILTGESDPVDRNALREKLEEQFVSLEIVDQTVPKRDLWACCGDGTLRGLTLDALKAQYDRAETPEQQQIAALAARYVLAAMEGRDTA